MALHYSLREIKNNSFTGNKPCYAVNLVTSGNVDLEDLADTINHMSSASQGDVTGILKNLVSLVAQELSNGNTVTLNGLGTFSLSAGLNKEITNPEQVTGNDIEVKRVCFKSSPDFRNKIKDVSFVRFQPGERWTR